MKKILSTGLAMALLLGGVGGAYAINVDGTSKKVTVSAENKKGGRYVDPDKADVTLLQVVVQREINDFSLMEGQYQNNLKVTEKAVGILSSLDSKKALRYVNELKSIKREHDKDFVSPEEFQNQFEKVKLKEPNVTSYSDNSYQPLAYKARIAFGKDFNLVRRLNDLLSNVLDTIKQVEIERSKKSPAKK